MKGSKGEFQPGAGVAALSVLHMGDNFGTQANAKRTWAPFPPFRQFASYHGPTETQDNPSVKAGVRWEVFVFPRLVAIRREGEQMLLPEASFLFETSRIRALWRVWHGNVSLEQITRGFVAK